MANEKETGKRDKRMNLLIVRWKEKKVEGTWRVK